jgi:Flp pilus assembly protein TadG
MIHAHPQSERRKGVAAVEFALLLPFIMVMLLGIWEVGRLINADEMVNNAAREGARQASTGLRTNAQVVAEVQYYLYQAMVGQGTPASRAQQVVNDAIITVQDLNSPGTDVGQATQLDQIQVTVSIPFSDVRWVALSLITNPSTRVNGQATFYCLKDQQFPTGVTAPAGF